MPRVRDSEGAGELRVGEAAEALGVARHTVRALPVDELPYQVGSQRPTGHSPWRRAPWREPAPRSSHAGCAVPGRS